MICLSGLLTDPNGFDAQNSPPKKKHQNWLKTFNFVQENDDNISLYGYGDVALVRGIAGAVRHAPHPKGDPAVSGRGERHGR